MVEKIYHKRYVSKKKPQALIWRKYDKKFKRDKGKIICINISLGGTYIGNSSILLIKQDVEGLIIRLCVWKNIYWERSIP